MCEGLRLHILFFMGVFSSIHLRGRLMTILIGPSDTIGSSLLSINLSLLILAGQGRMLDAETVTTEAMNVRQKSEDTKARR